MKKLKISSLYNNFHFLAIGLILLVISFENKYLILIFLTYVYFLGRKTPFLPLLLVLSFLVSLSLVQYQKPVLKENFQGLVINRKDDSYEVLTEKGKVLIYSKDALELGDYGYFQGKELSFNNKNVSYEKYLKSKNILLKYQLQDFKRAGNTFVLSKIQKFFLDYLDRNYEEETASYLKTLLFGYNALSSETKTASLNLGISHLLAISGLHLSLIIGFLTLFLDKFFYFNKPKEIIISLFLIFYMVVTNFSISVMRASLMVLLKIILKKKYPYLTNLDLYSIVLTAFLLIHPLIFYNLAFQLSFLVSFLMISLVKDFKSENFKLFKISSVAFFFSLPIVIKSNHVINFLTLILSPVYALYFELILLPISILIFCFPFLSNFFGIVFSTFTSSLNYLSKINDFKLVIGSFNLLEISLYYLFLCGFFIFFERADFKKTFFLLLNFLILFFYCKPYFNPFYEVVFYDIGQGDSILIKLPFNEGNLLCDATNNILDLLKADGVNKLSALMITHGDKDHVGKALEVSEFYGLKSFYGSAYDDSDLVKELQKSLKMKPLKTEDWLFLGSLKLSILGPIKKSNNLNNNSIVMKFEILNLTYLMTGDIEKEAEEALVLKYQDALKSDILKVPHHGSNTSSTTLFLEAVKPKVMVVSVGLFNRYHHPNALNVLNFPNLYRTDFDKTIKIRQLGERIIIKTG